MDYPWLGQAVAGDRRGDPPASKRGTRANNLDGWNVHCRQLGLAGFARCRCCCTGRAQHLIRRRQARNAPNRSAVLRSAARLSDEDAGEQGRRAWSGGLREEGFCSAVQCSRRNRGGEGREGRDQVPLMRARTWKRREPRSSSRSTLPARPCAVASNRPGGGGGGGPVRWAAPLMTARHPTRRHSGEAPPPPPTACRERQQAPSPRASRPGPIPSQHLTLFSHCICQCSSPLAGPSGEKKTGHIRPSPNHPPQGRKRKHHTLDPFTDGGTMAQHGRHWSQPANRGIAPVPAGRRALSRSREGPQRLVGRKPPDGCAGWGRPVVTRSAQHGRRCNVL